MADIKATIRQTSALKGSATSDKEIVAQSLRPLKIKTQLLTQEHINGK